MSKTEAFFVEFGRELWRQLTTRVFALWEIVLLLILVGKNVPWWIGVPGFILWIFIRNVRDSDGTATAAANVDLPVPQDCQARAESIAPIVPPIGSEHP